MKKLNYLILLLSVFFLFNPGKLIGQSEYNTVLGLRLNGGAGISAKHFINDEHSIEGILYTRWRGLNLTGIFAVNKAVFSEPGFNFFIGGGGHVGFWDRQYSPWWKEENEVNTRMVIGIDGQIGLEYTFREIPLNLAIDWKPAINLIGITNFWGSDAGLSVRYTFR